MKKIKYGKENQFQRTLVREIRDHYNNECIVTKLDSGYIQGIPDLLILHKDKWATLECKKSRNAHRQPNQQYYVDKMNKMSFSKFIYPENKEEVLNELYETLEP
ncbi:MAG: hypothetical protein PUJ51_24605 [Clostridiales bacterium]|nr:hypothetical protein [Clostridiales bacterium]